MDIHTLAVVLSIATLLQAIALSIQYVLDRTHRGSGWWALGSATSALGFAFTFLLDTPTIGPIVNVVNNTLFVSGLTLTYVGVLRCMDQRERRGALIAFTAVVALIPVYFPYFFNDPALRRVAISVAFAAILFLISHALFVHKTRSVAAAANFLAAVFLADGVFFVIRVVATLTAGPVEGPFTPTLTRTAGYVVALTASTLWTFGFIILVNQRLVADSREAKDNLERIFDTIPDGVSVTRTTDGSLVAVNQGFTVLSGFTRAEVLRTPGPEAHIWKDPADRQRMLTTLNETGSCDNVEAVFQRKDGSQLIGVMSAKRIALQGVPHTISVIRNITERKQAEEEREELRSQNRQLQKAASLGRMAGAIAHHFNNQLQAVTGHLELAVDDLPPSANVIEHMSYALGAARRASDMSGLMLTYLGQTIPERKPLDLAEACRRHLPLLVAAIPKRVVLKTDLPSPGPVVRADAAQIRQVVTNLITNAWEAAVDREESIRLTVKTVSAADIPTSHRFPIDTQIQSGAYTCLEVVDTGGGIAAGEIEELFDPFFSTKFVGRGMGLPVVLGMVRAHEGIVTVESEPGSGSVFSVYLPLVTADTP